MKAEMFRMFRCVILYTEPNSFLSVALQISLTPKFLLISSKKQPILSFLCQVMIFKTTIAVEINVVIPVPMTKGVKCCLCLHMGPLSHEMLFFTIFSKIANFTSENQQFGQVYTGYFLGNPPNLILDMSRNIGQPVEFYFRGGAWDPPLAAKLNEVLYRNRMPGNLT